MTNATILLVIGLLFALAAIVQFFSGGIGGRLGWWARKDQMPILFYGTVLSWAFGSVGFLYLGIKALFSAGH